MELYKKLRPESLEQMIGNEITIQIVEKQLERNEAHSFLISGPVGCGKTTLAKIMAKKFGGGSNVVHEQNASSERGIGDIRNIVEQCRFGPIVAQNEVWILDEAHGLTGDAANAFLKILGDSTPSHVYFVLCTTELGKMNSAIKSRCVSLQMNPLPLRICFQLLQSICKEIGIAIPKDKLLEIAEASNGVPRDAVQLLQAVSELNDPQKISEYLKQNAISDEDPQMMDFLRDLILKNLVWDRIAWHLTAMQKAGMDPEKIRRAVLTYVGKVLLNTKYAGRGIRESKIAASFIRIFSEPVYNSGFYGFVEQCYRATTLTEDNVKVPF